MKTRKETYLLKWHQAIDEKQEREEQGKTEYSRKLHVQHQTFHDRYKSIKEKQKNRSSKYLDHFELIWQSIERRITQESWSKRRKI